MDSKTEKDKTDYSRSDVTTSTLNQTVLSLALISVCVCVGVSECVCVCVCVCVCACVFCQHVALITI